MLHTHMGVNKKNLSRVKKVLMAGRKFKLKEISPCKEISTIRAPKTHGGVGIKDPTLMNLAMGTKILWRLVTKRYDWR
jgi:hypothetical protein